MSGPCRNLIVILGDQLNADAAAWDGFDPALDRVWMAEVAHESEKVWSHKARIALFLSAMRHFRNGLLRRGLEVSYRQLDDPDNRGSFAAELRRSITALSPQRLIVTRPGEWSVLEELERVAAEAGLAVEVRPDRHFLSSLDDFAEHAEGRKQLRMDFFYREMRRRYGWLMEGDRPRGGRWSLDRENRESFGKDGPGQAPKPVGFRPDSITREVIRLVRERFPRHPGSLAHFDWPLTPRSARTALRDFIEHRLAEFGPYQDAMWTDQPFLYHSRLSAALNLKLLDPRRVIEDALVAHQEGLAPLNSVEGFVRQILGWREFVRGIYWRFMPGYADSNTLEADAPLPQFYWTGETDMNCLREVIGQTLDHAYAHHIQRLMVTGNFALLLGVRPRAVHEWYLAVYADAVEWVELPNTLGMSQFADGGIMASKPYAATGKYIRRMSNYCDNCRYDPDRATGAQACPFTTLYWDFLLRNSDRLRTNPRMALQLRNAARLNDAERADLIRQARFLKEEL